MGQNRQPFYPFLPYPIFLSMISKTPEHTHPGRQTVTNQLDDLPIRPEQMTNSKIFAAIKLSFGRAT